MAVKKFISWNVNGLRACVGKGFCDAFAQLDADIFCVQETKLQQGQIDLNFDNYKSYWSYADKKGYSGTVVFTKEEPLSVTYGIGNEELDKEGRMITLEFDNYYFITEYVPNAQDGLKRIEHRLKWEDELRNKLVELNEIKPVIICGDLNVAHEEIDLKNPKTNHGNPGFSDEERGKLSQLLGSGFIDTFRYFYPQKENAYSWWSYRFHARDKNVGWRIDYFLASDSLKYNLINAAIHTEIFGSDHCPVELTAEL